ncbi:unnamed protein product [Lota lota]
MYWRWGERRSPEGAEDGGRGDGSRGHSYHRSSVTVTLMKKYGSGLYPSPAPPVPLADNLASPMSPTHLGPSLAAQQALASAWAP